MRVIVRAMARRSPARIARTAASTSEAIGDRELDVAKRQAAARARARSTSRTSAAASGTGVPGPKIAATPSRRRNS